MTFQLGAGLLDACVLAIVRENDTYGYSLTQDLREIVTISDSTLYPVLRRLKKDGYVEIYDQAFEGRNRRYYAITKEGIEKHNDYVTDWDEFKSKIDSILLGGNTVE